MDNKEERALTLVIPASSRRTIFEALAAAQLDVDTAQQAVEREGIGYRMLALAFDQISKVIAQFDDHAPRDITGPGSDLAICKAELAKAHELRASEYRRLSETIANLRVRVAELERECERLRGEGA